MNDDRLRELFTRATATDDGASRVNLHRVVQHGRRREYARRTAVVAGVGAVTAATFSVTSVLSQSGSGSGNRTAEPASAPTASTSSTTAPAVSTAPPAASTTAGAGSLSPAAPTPSVLTRNATDATKILATPPPAPKPALSADPACENVHAGSEPVGSSAAAPGSAAIEAAVRAAVPGTTVKTVDSGAIKNADSDPGPSYASVEWMGDVSDADGPSGVQIQVAAEGADPAEAAAREVLIGSCNTPEQTYRRTALPGGTIMLSETTSPATEFGYQVVAWTPDGSRVRASAMPLVCCLQTGPSKGAPYGDRKVPLLTIAQLEQIVTTLATG